MCLPVLFLFLLFRTWINITVYSETTMKSLAEFGTEPMNVGRKGPMSSLSIYKLEIWKSPTMHNEYNENNKEVNRRL